MSGSERRYLFFGILEDGTMVRNPDDQHVAITAVLTNNLNSV